MLHVATWLVFLCRKQHSEFRFSAFCWRSNQLARVRNQCEILSHLAGGLRNRAGVHQGVQSVIFCESLLTGGCLWWTGRCYLSPRAPGTCVSTHQPQGVRPTRPRCLHASLRRFRGGLPGEGPPLQGQQVLMQVPRKAPAVMAWLCKDLCGSPGLKHTAAKTNH